VVSVATGRLEYASAVKVPVSFAIDANSTTCPPSSFVPSHKKLLELEDMLVLFTMELLSSLYASSKADALGGIDAEGMFLKSLTRLEY
jgi:hypothetical protein